MPHRVMFALCVGLAIAPVARAQTDPFAWSEPDPDSQLARDRTEIPLGKAAVFVPSITGALNEPPVILVDATGDEVIDIPTGQRVLVDPGSYVVIVSSGSPMQGVGVAIDATEGDTTVIPVQWGALRIEVTDDHRVPHRGSYELIRADTREPYGTGFGADTLQGESLATWLLPPGVYRIVKTGSNYRALRDFATVYVPEAGFVRYRLVLDPDTGEFQGSGVLLPDEFGSPQDRSTRWFKSLVLGAVGSLAQTQNVVGVNNQLTAAGSLFVDGQLAYNVDDHSVSALLQVEEGASQIRPQEGQPLPLVKTRDRMRLDGLYTFYAKPWLGPYARVTGETQAFRTDVLVTDDTTLSREYASGTVQSEFVPANDTFFVADAWEPTLLREGTGLNTRFVNNRWVTLNVRLGLGLRQNRYGGAWVIEDLPRTSDIEYRQVDSFDQEGVESTIIATARLPGWAVYATDVEFFADFQSFDEPSIEWRNTLTLRITRNLSLNYYLNLERSPQVVDTLQLEQSVLLRASWAIL
ncbi:MAG: hypothetical protein ABMB14_08275 [Myxococcota bacterium]